MSETRSIVLELPGHIADTIETMAGGVGLTIGAWLGDQIEHAYGNPVLSRRDLGRTKRRASRRRRKTIAIRNRAARQAAKATGTPPIEPETPENV